MDLPQGFMEQFARLGVPALDALPLALESEPSVSVRFNPAKGAAPGDGADIVPWCADGCYLSDRPVFTFDPALHQGLYYVQDASSMFVSRVVRHLTAGGQPVRYLDACAAPGGKTTAAIASLPVGSIVVANEYVASRATVLRENLTKWGEPCVVKQGDTSRFAADGAVFDIIAADVPCSGEGMMRKDPKAVEQWTPRLVDECVARQRQIIDSLWLALAPGGYLIYSTCTFNRSENEEMVRYMAERYGAEPTAVPVDPSWGILPAIGCDFPAFRFIPGAVRGEGLFMAVVRKPQAAGDAGLPRPKKDRKKKDMRSKPAAVPAGVAGWLLPGADADLTIGDDGTVTAVFPCRWPEFPYRARLDVATVKGRDAVPTQELAMSRWLNTGAFNTCEVDTPTALEYLRAQAVTLPEATPRGIVLLACGGRPLGFVKNIGSRANNLYPRAWRILR